MVFLCFCGGLIWENRVHVCGTTRCSCGGIQFDGRAHCCGYKPDYSIPPTDYELWKGFRTSDEWMGSPNWGKRSPSLFNTQNQETRILNIASSMDEIKNLQQTGSFQDYCNSFDFLLSKVILSEDYATNLFLGGLKPEISWWVKFLRPKTLEEAYEKAKNQVNFLVFLNRNKELDAPKVFDEMPSSVENVIQKTNDDRVIEIHNKSRVDVKDLLNGKNDDVVGESEKNFKELVNEKGSDVKESVDKNEARVVETEESVDKNEAQVFETEMLHQKIVKKEQLNWTDAGWRWLKDDLSINVSLLTKIESKESTRKAISDFLDEHEDEDNNESYMDALDSFSWDKIPVYNCSASGVKEVWSEMNHISWSFLADLDMRDSLRGHLSAAEVLTLFLPQFFYQKKAMVHMWHKWKSKSLEPKGGGILHKPEKVMFTFQCLMLRKAIPFEDIFQYYIVGGILKLSKFGWYGTIKGNKNKGEKDLERKKLVNDNQRQEVDFLKSQIKMGTLVYSLRSLESQQINALLLGHYVVDNTYFKVHIIQRSVVGSLTEMFQSTITLLREISAFVLKKLVKILMYHSGRALKRIGIVLYRIHGMQKHQFVVINKWYGFFGFSTIANSCYRVLAVFRKISSVFGKADKMCNKFRSEMNKLELVRVENFEWKPGWEYVLKMSSLFKASWFLSNVWTYVHLLTFDKTYKSKYGKTQLSCKTDCDGNLRQCSLVTCFLSFQWGIQYLMLENSFTMMAASLVALIKSTCVFSAISRSASATFLPPSVLSCDVCWHGVGILFSRTCETGSSSSIENESLVAMNSMSSI